MSLKAGSSLTSPERAKPWWLVLAVCLQGATYLAQGEIFRRVPRAAGYRLSLTAAYELSLAKLFIDQALPSAGIGSTIVVAQALERRAVPRAVVAASMVINIASYHAAYVVCLGIALAITAARGEAHVPVLVVSVLFLGFSVAVTTGSCSSPVETSIASPPGCSDSRRCGTPSSFSKTQTRISPDMRHFWSKPPLGRRSSSFLMRPPCGSSFSRWGRPRHQEPSSPAS